MQALTERIIQSSLKNRIFSDVQLQQLLPGSNQSRHGLVHRAMAAGDVLRIRRGLYTLNNTYRDHPCHPFAIAQALSSLSYISLETALAWHGWIPEAVQVVTSVIPGRKQISCESPDFGSFSFVSLALEKEAYLLGVERHQADAQTFLLATPLRALLDLVCLRKFEWSGAGLLTRSLRIEQSALDGLTGADCARLAQVYKHQRTRNFIASLTELVSTQETKA